MNCREKTAPKLLSAFERQSSFQKNSKAAESILRRFFGFHICAHDSRHTSGTPTRLVRPPVRRLRPPAPPTPVPHTRSRTCTHLRPALVHPHTLACATRARAPASPAHLRAVLARPRPRSRPPHARLRHSHLRAVLAPATRPPAPTRRTRATAPTLAHSRAKRQQKRALPQERSFLFFPFRSPPAFSIGWRLSFSCLLYTWLKKSHPTPFRFFSPPCF